MRHEPRRDSRSPARRSYSHRSFSRGDRYSPPPRRPQPRGRSRRSDSRRSGHDRRYQDRRSFGRGSRSRSRSRDSRARSYSSSRGSSRRRRRRAGSKPRNGMVPPFMPMPGMPFPMMFPPFWSWPMAQGDSAGRSTAPAPRKRARSRSASSPAGNCKDSVLVRRNLMGRVIGKGGSIIKTIRQESGARVEAEDRDEDHCEFRLSGTEEQVQRAKAMIREQADRVSLDRPLGDQIEESEIGATLEYPASIIGALIGSRGAKINEVRENSGAKVQVKKHEETCKVLIAGSDEQVASARELVEFLADEARQITELPKTGEEDLRLEFPIAVAGRIIGSRGHQISEVRAKSGAQVKIEKLEEVCRVYLGGTPEQVETAKKMVNNLVEEKHYTPSAPRRTESEETVEIPLSMVGRVIGKGGETVQRLQRDSGAKIDVNNQLDPAPVRLVGPPDAVMRAKYLLGQLCERAGQTPEWRVQPPAYPGYDPWAMWSQGGCAGYMPPGMPMSAASWDAPAGDGGGARGGKSPRNAESKSDEEIDLDEQSKSDEEIDLDEL